jgi:hypothetical protein
MVLFAQPLFLIYTDLVLITVVPVTLELGTKRSGNCCVRPIASAAHAVVVRRRK